MYARDPRRSWTLMIGHSFKLMPWQMYDLTPTELDAMLANADAKPEII